MTLSASDGSPLTRAEHRRASATATRNGISIGIATGAYGLSFGALSIASGLTLAQTCTLSLMMFTGGSQFAFVGVVASGGALLAAAVSAVLLGTRNALYGVALNPILRPGPTAKPLVAHVVIDESSAMALGAPTEDSARAGFWSAGLGVLFFWNLATLFGALGANLLPDPRALGLDAVAPAAFLALIAPRLAGQSRAAAVIGAAAALLAVPLLPTGTPVLAAAAAVLFFALFTTRHRTAEGA